MPIVAVLPELLAVLVAALLLVLLLVSAQLYYNGRQARGFAGGLPIIASPVITAIDGLLATIQHAAELVDKTLQAQLVWAVQGLGHIVVVAFNAAGAVILTLIHHTAALLAVTVVELTHLRTVVVPQLGVRLAGAVTELVRLRDHVIAALVHDVAGLAHFVTVELVGRVMAVERAVAALIPFLGMLERLASLGFDPAAALQADAQQLGRIAGGVGALGADLGAIGARVGTLETDLANSQATLARLVALLALAGVGAVALENLLRLAKDPCYCLTQGSFSDLPGRVEALENFGP